MKILCSHSRTEFNSVSGDYLLIIGSLLARLEMGVAEVVDLKFTLLNEVLESSFSLIISMSVISWLNWIICFSNFGKESVMSFIIM